MSEEQFVDLQEINNLIALQREHQLLQLQTELALTKIENIKLQMKLKYSLTDADRVDSSTGLITKSIP